MPPSTQYARIPEVPRQLDRPCSSPRSRWGELKRQRALSLTDYAWELLGSTAEHNNFSRSEFLERLIRAHLETT